MKIVLLHLRPFRGIRGGLGRGAVRFELDHRPLDAARRSMRASSLQRDPPLANEPATHTDGQLPSQAIGSFRGH